MMNKIYYTVPPYKGITTIIGSDTYLGAHMSMYLKESGQKVFDFNQDKELSFDNIEAKSSDWIVVCLDPSIGFEQYIMKVKTLCDYLTQNEYSGKICYLSSASICQSSSQPITENSTVTPRSENDAMFILGETLFTVLMNKIDSKIVSHIVRIGVPFGDEIGFNQPCGFINRFIRQASNDVIFAIPGMGSGLRTITHITDICHATIELMKQDSCPLIINIPGEDITIIDVACTVSEHFGTDFDAMTNTPDNEDLLGGNQNLSGTLFSSQTKFKFENSFSTWLDSYQLPKTKMTK